MYKGVPYLSPINSSSESEAKDNGIWMGCLSFMIYWIYCGMRKISTIKTAAHDRMQVNATIVVAMITDREWSRPCCGAGGLGISFIWAS